ncbi:MAG: hypothetical protein ACO1NW_15135 [Chitinophagaceae bacterium]
MKQLLVVFFLLFCAGASAQSVYEQIKSARFRIVRHTIEFISNDAQSFKNVKSHTCADCKSYAALEQFVQTNKIVGADRIINRVKTENFDTAAATSIGSLEKFAQALQQEITAGERIRRKELPAFNTYVTQVDGIIEETEKALTAPPAAPVLADGPAPHTITGVPEGDETAEDKAANANAAMKGNAAETADGAMNLPAIAGFAAAALFAFIAYRANTKANKAKSAVQDIEKRKGDIQNLYLDSQQTIKAAHRDLETLQQDLVAEKEENTRLRKELKTLKKSAPEQTVEVTKQAPEPRPEKNTVPTPVAPPAPVPAKEKPAPPPKFARYADTGDGFSAAYLLDEPNSETIFEIRIINGGTASFKVSELPQVQRYALSNISYFFDATCQYNSFPSENSTIRTDVPGELRWNGDKWSIVNRAQISFH